MKIQDVEWYDTVPPEIREIAEEHLKAWWLLLPTWCQEFRVNFDPENKKTLSIGVNFPGRWAVLHLTPRWLQEIPKEREVGIIHELIHVNLEPISTATNRILGDLTEKGTPLRELADSIITDGLEGSTEDLARAFFRLHNPP